MVSVRWSSVLLCGLSFACVPSLPVTPAVDVTPQTEAARPSAVDPRTDPSVFDVEMDSERQARGLAAEKCGPDYRLVERRAVARTATEKCQRGMLAGALSSFQTTHTGASAETCTPASSSTGTVYRFRCGNARATSR